MNGSYLRVIGLGLLLNFFGCGAPTEPSSTPTIEQGLCESHPNNPCCPGSPIILDLDGNGFTFTDRADGVTFDLHANGLPRKLAWTAAGSDDAWLVLDRNENGIIDDGSEMFGNFTEQPQSSAPNGFVALGVFDEPEAGGNNDRIIDVNDGIFARLRLWQDRNHNGISEPAELLSLPEGGVRALSLDYSTSNRTDEYGNNFRYGANVQSEKGARVGPLMYDVFLTTRSAKAASFDGTTNDTVFRKWRCSASCMQTTKPPWDPFLYCTTTQIDQIGPYDFSRDTACLLAINECLNTLVKDTTHCTQTGPLVCANCRQEWVNENDEPVDPPPGC
jgi:hypothetical protein